MNTWINITRYHLVDWVNFVGLCWGTLTIAFAVNVAIFASVPGGHTQAHYTGALATIYLTIGVLGALIISRPLPFALALGLSRRSFYAGTALLAVALAAVYGLVLTVLQLIERASGGWGINLYFFRVPFLLAGPWYLTWLTSFVGLVVMFGWGLWFGLVYRRWNLLGLLAFAGIQVVVLTAAIVLIFLAHGWPSVGHFFTTLTLTGLIGLLTALTAALVAGGYATIRRVTV
jgi:hypothetical protein